MRPKLEVPMDKGDLKNRIFAIMRDIFDADDVELREDFKMGDLKDWDSIGHVRFLLAIEEEFKIKLPFEKMNILSDVKSILGYLENMDG